MPSIKKLMFPSTGGARADAGLTLVRVVAGAALMLHGLPKIQNPFGWMGPDSAMPSILQALAALSEFGGGLAWVLGALTPLASLGILSTMAVAVWTHASKGQPFVGKGGSYELALVFFSVALLLMLGGPGRFSVDRLLSKVLGRKADAPEPATAPSAHSARIAS